MNQSTLQLILALLPVAERLVFDVGGKLIQISTADLTDPAEIKRAIEEASAAGFPQLSFVSGSEQ